MTHEPKQHQCLCGGETCLCHGEEKQEGGHEHGHKVTEREGCCGGSCHGEMCANDEEKCACDDKCDCEEKCDCDEKCSSGENCKCDDCEDCDDSECGDKCECCDDCEREAQIGVDFIGVGVGALIFNDDGKFLMALRGLEARNERNKWEIPGGKVEFGETLVNAIKREIKEELDIEVEVGELLHVADHIILDEQQHWVSPTFRCTIVSGTPRVCEPEKCSEVRWFSLEEARQVPLSIVTEADIAILEKNEKKS